MWIDMHKSFNIDEHLTEQRWQPVFLFSKPSVNIHVCCSYIELSRSKLHKTGDLQVGNWHVNCQHSSFILIFCFIFIFNFFICYSILYCTVLYCFCGEFVINVAHTGTVLHIKSAWVCECDRSFIYLKINIIWKPVSYKSGPLIDCECTIPEETSVRIRRCPRDV